MEVGPRTPRREPLDLFGRRRAFDRVATFGSTRVPRRGSPARAAETRRPLRAGQFTVSAGVFVERIASRGLRRSTRPTAGIAQLQRRVPFVARLRGNSFRFSCMVGKSRGSEHGWVSCLRRAILARPVSKSKAPPQGPGGKPHDELRRLLDRAQAGDGGWDESWKFPQLPLTACLTDSVRQSELVAQAHEIDFGFLEPYEIKMSFAQNAVLRSNRFSPTDC